jgi:hypothetical protein
MSGRATTQIALAGRGGQICIGADWQCEVPDGMVEPEPGSTPTQGVFSQALRVMVRIAGTG